MRAFFMILMICAIPFQGALSKKNPKLCDALSLVASTRHQQLRKCIGILRDFRAPSGALFYSTSSIGVGKFKSKPIRLIGSSSS